MVECVPNFSEGNDHAVIQAIAGAIRSVEGVKLLNVDPGADFNRTVFTFVGGPEEVLEGAFQAAKVGTALIDMRKHKGEHARMGALDVVPFIPLQGCTMEDCIDLSKRFGERMARELGIPVYLYARSASRPDRVRLPDIRKGEYEGLEDNLKDPQREPDFGGSVFVARSGVTATGARPILIAYNVNLDTSDKDAASEISGLIRESGHVVKDQNGDKVLGPDGKPLKVPGMFRGVQAGGMMYNEDIAQVSMNLMDHEEVNLHHVFEAVKGEASKRGISLKGSEIVGLVPMSALVMAGKFYRDRDMPGMDLSDDGLIDLAIKRLGLDALYPFDKRAKVIESMVGSKDHLSGSSITGFLSELASDSPAPGGGSVAALAGACGAALMDMVCNLTLGKEKYQATWDQMRASSSKLCSLRTRLAQLIDEDTSAFNEVMAAFKLPKGTEDEKSTRSEAIQRGYKKAIATPLETAESCLEVLKLGPGIAAQGNKSSISDVGVGSEMARTGLEGAVMNIRINLGSVKDENYVSDLKGRIGRMLAEADELAQDIRRTVNENL